MGSSQDWCVTDAHGVSKLATAGDEGQNNLRKKGGEAVGI